MDIGERDLHYRWLDTPSEPVFHDERLQAEPDPPSELNGPPLAAASDGTRMLPTDPRSLAASSD